MFKESSYLKTTAVALAPILLGSAASYLLTFRCCDGLAMVPAPGLGYVRWDIAYAIYAVSAAGMAVVALLVTILTKPPRSIPVLVVIYAILIHQVETRWGSDFGKYLSTIIWGYDPDMTTPHDVPWVTTQMERRYAQDGSPHVRTSEKPLLTPQECQEFVSYALQHADDWMNSHTAIPPTLYAAFGGDINYGYSQLLEFEAYRPWHDRFPWLSNYLPRWNYFYGFERFMARESAATNQTYLKDIQEIYAQGLRPHLEKIRQGLARHFDVAATQIIMGGDDGTVLHDFSPPSAILGLPNYVRQWDNNFHFDTIPWGTRVIEQRLQEEGIEDPCAGGHDVHAGTLALEIPRDGAGMLWWLDDKENPGHVLKLFTPYRLGYIATVPGTVFHSIAPYNYTGWFDTKRITLQMFMLQCVDEADISTWYVFH